MADTNLDIVIRSALDSRGFEDLQGRLRNTAEGAEGAKIKTTEFSTAISDLGKSLLAATGLMIGTAEAVGFLKESFTAAVEDSRVLDQMTAANKLLAKATDDSTEANKEWVASVQAASGITKNELIPNYLRLLEATGDVEKAQRLLNIAAGAAARGMGDLGQIVQALSRYWLTGEVGTRGFGLAIKALNDEGIRGDAVFQTLEKRYGDAGASAENAGLKVDRAKRAWDETKEAVGRLFLNLQNDLLPSVKAVGEAFGVLYFMIQFGLSGLKQWANILPSIGRASLEFLSGHFGEAKRIMEAANAENEKVFNAAMLRVRNFTTDLKGIYNDYKKGVEVGSGELAGAHEKETAAIYGTVQMTEILDQAVKGLGKSVAEEAAKEIAADKAREKAGDDAFQSFMANETKKIAAADRRFRTEDQTYKKLHGLDQNYLEGYVVFLRDQEAAFKGSEAVRLGIHADLIHAEIELDRLKARNEMQISFMLADAALGFMGSVFGKSKAYAIANAIISTYKAATSALDWEPKGWWNFAAAGLVIATGLANVATIAETEPGGAGGGFDDPSNDFAARVGGRKWARDMVSQYSQGAAAGFSEGLLAGAGPSISNVMNRGGDKTIHITLNAGIGTDRTQLMRFVKNDLVPVLNRYDQRRTLS